MIIIDTIKPAGKHTKIRLLGAWKRKGSHAATCHFISNHVVNSYEND